MANGRDKALRLEGLTALCEKLKTYFKKIDTAGSSLLTLTETVNSGFQNVEEELDNLGQASSIQFTDGENLQQKYDDGDLGGGGSTGYTLPIASPDTLGGVKAKVKTDAETVEVAVDQQGKLYVPAGSSSGGDSYVLPVASAKAIGGVKGPLKTETQTQQAHIDSAGGIWVNPPTGEPGESAYQAAKKGGYEGLQNDFYDDLGAMDNLAEVLEELNGAGSSLPAGEKGDPGESAYDSAKAGGYQGTKKDFYTDLGAIDDLANKLDEINGIGETSDIKYQMSLSVEFPDTSEGHFPITITGQNITTLLTPGDRIRLTLQLPVNSPYYFKGKNTTGIYYGTMTIQENGLGIIQPDGTYLDQERVHYTQDSSNYNITAIGTETDVLTDIIDKIYMLSQTTPNILLGIFPDTDKDEFLVTFVSPFIFLCPPRLILCVPVLAGVGHIFAVGDMRGLMWDSTNQTHTQTENMRAGYIDNGQALAVRLKSDWEAAAKEA